MDNVSQEKYTSELQYRSVQLRRWALRGLIEHLVEWPPLAHPVEGYSIILGCNTALAPMLACNLQFLARQDLKHVDKVFVVFDCPRSTVAEIEEGSRSRFPSLPLEFLYYSDAQRRRCAAIKWPWVQSWLSWALGIAQTRTRFAMLHDFDAMLLRPTAVEERYESIRERGHQYLGVRHYEGNGVLTDDRLVTTFELMFDCEFVRRAFRPLDLFNHVTRFRGRRVDFDTFLYAQAVRGTGSVLPLMEEDIVHPSQLICQFEDLRNGRRAVPASNNLLLVPYFMYVGGEREVLRAVAAELDASDFPHVTFFGKRLDISGIRPKHLFWMATQAFRLDYADVGKVRDEVYRYFQSIDRSTAKASGRAPAFQAPATGPSLDWVRALHDAA